MTHDEPPPLDTSSGQDPVGSVPTRRSDFYPLRSLEGKRNYKRFYFVERDGSVRESVHLDVPDSSHREQLVCVHFLRHTVRTFLRKDVGISVLGRDCPWDFRLQLSTGTEFFLEVTSLADSQQHFEVNKREERFRRWTSERFIPVHELRKLATLFPTPELGGAVASLANDRLSNTDLVQNPLFESGPRIFLSTMPGLDTSLTGKIQAAIESKADKKHAHKDATVVVVDNRSSLFDLPDLRVAMTELASFLADLPFPEVWFYTGYYSDDDGNNAEFSFVPLKVRPEQADVLDSLQVDDRGIHVW